MSFRTMLMGGIEPPQTGNYPECSCTGCLMVVNHSGQHFDQYHQHKQGAHPAPGSVEYLALFHLKRVELI